MEKWWQKIPGKVTSESANLAFFGRLRRGLLDTPRSENFKKILLFFVKRNFIFSFVIFIFWTWHFSHFVVIFKNFFVKAKNFFLRK